jgi:hypothetical protein
MLRRIIYLALFGFLGVYSVTLLLTEVLVSQNYARFYFSDIHGPVALYAVNTTLSVSLLWGTALLFFIAARFASEAPTALRARLFLWSQVALFALLGLDDRFQIHEMLSERLGLHDETILLALGLAELGALTFLGRVWLRAGRARFCVSLGALCFALMLVLKQYTPPGWAPSLALEDLAKTWASACLFLFGWDEMRTAIDAASDTDDPIPETD